MTRNTDRPTVTRTTHALRFAAGAVIAMGVAAVPVGWMLREEGVFKIVWERNR